MKGSFIPEEVVSCELEVEQCVVGVGDEGEVLSPLEPKHQVLDIEPSEEHQSEQHHTQYKSLP